MKVLLSQIIIPYSKLEFFKILSTKLKGSLIIFAGEDTFEEGIKSAGKEINEVIVSRNKFYLNKSFYRTKGFLKYYFSHNMVICTFTMRSIDMYSILFLNFFFNKKLIFWGHIDGKNKRLDPIRYYIARMADHFICYSKSDAKRLNSLVPKLNKNITYLGNSIVTKSDCVKIRDSVHSQKNKRENLIYSGRISESKKIIFLVKLFINLKKDNKCIFENLIIIGDGNQMSQLKDICNQSIYGDFVKIYGFVTDKMIIKKIYSSALYSISPGYVGLSCIQSFAHGVPMIINKNEDHSPEIESCYDGINSIHFENEDELKHIMSDYSNLCEAKWNRTEIINDIIDNYTIDNMAAKFLDAINKTN